MRRSLIHILLLIFCFLIIINSETWAQTSTQSTGSDTTIAATGQQSTEAKAKTEKKSDIQNLWKLISLAGSIGLVILGVFSFGMFFVVQEILKARVYRKNSKRLLEQSFDELSLEEIKEIVFDQKQANIISELFSRLLNIYEETRTAKSFNEEIGKFKQVLQERFDTFKTRMAFFSDTCGALGLIGTVWGMYRTFYGGTLDQQIILTGMGIALVTTLLGLVASMILNLFTTEICTSFNKRLDVVTDKSHEFQVRMIEEEKKENQGLTRFAKSAVMLPPEMVAVRPKEKGDLRKQPIEEPPLPPPPPRIGPPSQIEVISGDNQAGPVNTELKQPLEVEVRDQNDNKLKGRTVVFSIEKGNGTLSNGSRREEKVTNENGRAETILTLGSIVGENVVKAAVAGENGEWLECRFKATGQAAEPSILKYVSGNYQNGLVSGTLEKPLVVQVTDAFDNPIRNYKVTFKVEFGSGRFPGSKDSTFEGTTDPDGLLAVPFVLGNEPGLNKVSVVSKGLRRSRLEFEVFGQPRGVEEHV